MNSVNRVLQKIYGVFRGDRGFFGNRRGALEGYSTTHAVKTVANQALPVSICLRTSDGAVPP